MYQYKRWKHAQFLMQILDVAQNLGISLMVNPIRPNDKRYSYCLYLAHKKLLNQHIYFNNTNDPQSDAECHFDITSQGQELLDTYKEIRDEMTSNCNTISIISREQFPLIFCIILWIVGTLSISYSQMLQINWMYDFAIGGIIVLLSFWKSCQESYWNRQNKRLQESIYKSFDL